MDLAFDTRIAFVSMQAEEQQLEMRRQVLASTEASLTSAQELREAGNVTSLDVDNQQTLLDRARLNVAVAEAAVVVSRERLNRLMGLWGDDVEWQAAQRLPDVPSELPPGDLEAQAVESSVDLALARQRIEFAGRQLGMTETTALIPELHVGPLIAREEGSTRIGAIVEVPLSLFDRGPGALCERPRRAAGAAGGVCGPRGGAALEPALGTAAGVHNRAHCPLLP